MLRARICLSFLLVACAATAALVACGDDDDRDAAAVVDGGGAADAGTGLQAIAANRSVYLGGTATLDASRSGADTYAWTIASAPPGSTAALTGADTATPSLTPDVLGTYALRLTITLRGTTAAATVNVVAVDPSVFYLHVGTDGGPTLEGAYAVVPALLGDGGAPVSCFTIDAGGSGALASLPLVAQTNADVWEAPAGQPGRLVTVGESHEDGGAQTALVASTAGSTCATSGRVLERVDGSFLFGDRLGLQQPSLAPDGARVAFLRATTSAEPATLVTIGFDGQDRRDLSTVLPPDNDQQLNGTFPRPIWADATTLVWAEGVKPTGWNVKRIKDAPGAAAELLMSCTPGIVAQQIALLPNGDVLAAGYAEGVANRTIVVYTPDPVTKACGKPRDLVKLNAEDGLARATASRSPPTGPTSRSRPSPRATRTSSCASPASTAHPSSPCPPRSAPARAGSATGATSRSPPRGRTPGAA